MPSEPASVRPCNTELIVADDETLMAGNAKGCLFAVSSISAYWSGVAIGMSPSLPSRRKLGTRFRHRRIHPFADDEDADFMASTTPAPTTSNLFLHPDRNLGMELVRAT